MSYVCVNCGKEIDKLESFIRCPYCGGRRLVKKRPNVPREISTD
ncbi:DNA-directed RNA polymerase subunit P [Candidatus Marsarchaeota archaeon]|nr:DNA-directed RNA polymerase subunit P [Candidatus Marsarchaeota archaeon]MCL5404757.1 DNA-directed RNA polymerase subunit P [Candidatus Marsarchaeota archaeon]